jgi:small-conductance mechanosensitive channel
MQFPAGLDIDIVSTYGQLATDGAQFLAVAALLYALGRLIAVPTARWTLSRTAIDKTLASALTSTVNLLSFILAVVIGASAAGFRGALAGSTLLAAGITLAVGLAAQDVLGNFVAGAFIVTDPDLNVGDTISWDGMQGTVVDIDLRVTRIRTPDNERIIVPNTALATSAVTNQTSTGPIGISYQFGVGYDDDVEAVQAIVENAARDFDHVLDKPEPTARASDLSSTSVVLTGRVWIPNARRNRMAVVRSAFVQRVHEACRAEGIDSATRHSTNSRAISASTMALRRRTSEPSNGRSVQCPAPCRLRDPQRPYVYICPQNGTYMDEKRFVVALFGLAVAVVVGALAYQFIAALTVSVFLYYSTRRYYSSLRRLRLPARVRAVVVMASLAIPLLLLVSYATVLIIVEARQFVTQYALVDVAAAHVGWLDGAESVPDLTVEGLYSAYQSGQLSPFVDFLSENAMVLTSVVSQFALNLFITTIVTYYLLVDGRRIREWLLRFDDGAIIREYLEAVDEELEAVLFGNLLNVLAISLIAIAAFTGYNAVAPAAVEVPYPTLAGALTGIASLIPVVGMKVIYIPLTGIAALPVVLDGQSSLLVYVFGFLLVAVVIVDTIPDLLLRPLLSGESTHVGLLMLAYTLGPVVLGFYGLFFAPILLVVGMTFANTALPRLLGASEPDGIHPDQLRLEDFG